MTIINITYDSQQVTISLDDNLTSRQFDDIVSTIKYELDELVNNQGLDMGYDFELFDIVLDICESCGYKRALSNVYDYNIVI